jgi:DNA-directed RNA polymerase alpha subunit
MNQPFNTRITPTRDGFRVETHRGVDPATPEFRVAEEACEPHLRAAMIGLFAGNIRAAHAAVERAAEALRPARDETPFGARSLTEIGLDLRWVNAIEERFGVVTVGELLLLECAALEGVPNVGPKAIREIYRVLAAAAVTRVVELEAKSG